MNNMSDQLNNQKEMSKIDTMRHSAAHVLAMAVRDLHPTARFGIGPVVENGFYYDVETDEPVTEEQLKELQKKMKKIVRQNHTFERAEIDIDEARERFSELGQKYKVELIDDLKKEGEKQVSIYKSGDFVDLCTGPHVDSTGEISADGLTLTKLAGAYWKGDEKREQLQRIYGVLFENRDELNAYVKNQEEALKRDHRKLGKELDLFTFSPLVGSGLPLFTPKGTILREELNAFSQDLRAKRGFQKVWVPHITKKDLYETSGHWEKFGDELFLVKSQETDDELVMKPMNCPHHQQIYASRPRSYRDLPLRFMETTTIYRDEKAGELLGLSRVRSITQDDSHVFCTPEQLEDEYNRIIETVQEFYAGVDMPLSLRLSFCDPAEPEKYLGDKKLWDKAQKTLEELAKKNGLDYVSEEGEAAFYGPKIDFMAVDSLGRQWQVATAQLDFVQPERFQLAYADADGTDKQPVMIHLAIMGSIERFLSVYIEHTAGAFPLWCAPVQAVVIPVSEKFSDYAHDVMQKLEDRGMRVEIAEGADTLGKRISEAQKQRVPYMLVVGEKEKEAGAVAVRSRTEGDEGSVSLDELLERLQKEISEKM